MSGIYIHIPFCKQACSYCDFHFSTAKNYQNELVDCLIQELELKKDRLLNSTIETIYFGGGTPSLLTELQLAALIRFIKKNYSLSNNIEITLEANPDDINDLNLEIWKRCGINRLSIGIQSFHESELQLMNRAHTSTEALNAIQKAKKKGFQNISIDLIYGVPKSDLNTWTINIEKAIELNVQHISAYCLTVEDKTALKYWVQKNQVRIPTDQMALDQFRLLGSKLEEAGFEQYEISNFSKTNFRSRHNTSYWQGKEYLGIGPSAHSFIIEDKNQVRTWNISNNPQYIKKVNNHDSFEEREILTEKDIFNEFILTRLRTIEGINKLILETILPKKFSTIFYKLLNQFIQEETIEETIDHYKLTMKGKFIADKIISDLFYIH